MKGQGEFLGLLNGIVFVVIVLLAIFALAKNSTVLISFIVFLVLLVVVIFLLRKMPNR